MFVDYLGFILEIYLILILLFLIIWALLSFENSKNIIFINSLLNFILVILLFSLFLTNDKTYSFLNFHFYNNIYIYLIKILLIFIFAFIMFFSAKFLQKHRLYAFEYLILTFLVLISLGSLLNSSDFFAMYLSIELQSLSLFILCCLRKSQLGLEAGFKYFSLSGLASGFLVFGVTLIYGLLGTTNFYDILYFFNSTLYLDYGYYWLIVSLVFIISGLLFKIAAAPFHFWAPDVYDGVPLVITAFFTIFPKFGLLIFLFKIFIIFYLFFPFIFNKIFLFSGFLSLIVGSLGALYQIRLKRLMAYSSIAHVGFILLSLVSSSFQIVSYTLNYLIIYVLLSQLFFFPLLMLFSFFYSDSILYVNELGSFLKKNPVLAIIFMLNFFSMVGVPPLSGFFSKFFILLGLIQYNYYFIVLIILLFSVLTAVYYLRLVQASMFSIKKISGFFFNIEFYKGYIISFIFFITIFWLLLQQIVLSLLFFYFNYI